MAVSCPEMMYGAYYPYLYGRAGPSRSFYQYDRFNQDLYSSSGVPLAPSSASGSSHSPCSPILPPSIAAPAATVSSAQSVATAAVPTIPLGTVQRHVTKEEDLSGTRSDTEVRIESKHGPLPSSAHNDSSCSSGPESPHAAAADPTSDGQPARAQYVSATCVVFTHYSGDAATVVDEHFSRALNFSNKESKDGSSPMSARNFPASFWNSNYVPPTPAPTHPQVPDLYSADGSYSTDPWVPHHYGSYAAHAHAHAAHAYHHHHNMAQYGSLLRLPQQYGHGSRLHHDQQTAHALESAAAYSSYPTMAGLEAQVQESSKDLYWF
ncbi:protein vestigial isoform X2 [Phlebotomus papatasi]|uniref:protein vestigial isoform X2 n=1 Tax=Phlebotomus papatasi TaxID=29031 RepID=UPI0024846562|nr:protein vestigial isoform X2 [Phlebotomus papatasi]